MDCHTPACVLPSFWWTRGLYGIACGETSPNGSAPVPPVRPTRSSSTITLPCMLSLCPMRRFPTSMWTLSVPQPPCDSYSYLFTITDRCTQWPEVVLLRSTIAQDCAEAWCRVPRHVTSDRGPHSTSSLWSSIVTSLGVQLLSATAYHPQSSGANCYGCF